MRLLVVAPVRDPVGRIFIGTQQSRVVDLRRVGSTLRQALVNSANRNWLQS